VPGERIIFSYDMRLNERRISVSLTTVEIRPVGARTRLVFTEQGRLPRRLHRRRQPRGGRPGPAGRPGEGVAGGVRRFVGGTAPRVNFLAAGLGYTIASRAEFLRRDPAGFLVGSRRPEQEMT